MRWRIADNSNGVALATGPDPWPGKRTERQARSDIRIYIVLRAREGSVPKINGQKRVRDKQSENYNNTRHVTAASPGRFIVELASIGLWLLPFGSWMDGVENGGEWRLGCPRLVWRKMAVFRHRKWIGWCIVAIHNRGPRFFCIKLYVLSNDHSWWLKMKVRFDCGLKKHIKTNYLSIKLIYDVH